MEKDAPATAGQIQYVKTIFRGIAPDKCGDDAQTAAEVKARTGYDLDSLTHGQVQEIVAKFAPRTNRTQINKHWSRQLKRNIG